MNEIKLDHGDWNRLMNILQTLSWGKDVARDVQLLKDKVKEKNSQRSAVTGEAQPKDTP